jgi:hypothetical protein
VIKGRPNLTAVVAVLSAVAILLPAWPGTQVVGAGGLVLCAGVAVVGRFSSRELALRYRLSLTIAAGLLVFLCVGALLGSVLSAAGVDQPLSRVPLACSWVVLLAGYVVLVVRRGLDPIRATVHGVTRREVAWGVVLAVPPLLALWGAVSLNTARSGSLAVFVAAAVIAMAVLAVAGGVTRWGPPPVMALISALVTGAIQGPLRGGWLAGVDTQHEFYIGTLAIHQATFPLAHYVDPYGGMLSLTVLPTELHSLLGINLRTTMVVLPAVFLGLCVLALWSALTERLSSRMSALLLCLFVLGSVPLVQELPQITRQCYALFFFSILVLALTSTRLPTPLARVAAVIGGVGVVVTHYSTAYLAAGGVLCGYLLSLVLRSDRSRRVLTTPVTVVVVAMAGLWGGLVAKTGDSISKVLSSIRADGFSFLPGGGSIVTRWLHAASISRLVNAKVIRVDDLALLHRYYTWMSVLPAASHVPFLNDPAPTARGVPVLGGGLSLASSVLAQLVLLLAVVAVGTVVVVCRRRRDLAALAGISLFFLGFAAVSRFSQTIGVDFSPSRVEAQAYLLFVVVVAIALEAVPWRAWLSKLPRVGGGARVAVGSLLAVLAVGTSTQLDNFAVRGGTLPVNLSFRGEEAQRLITPSDVLAARWLVANRPSPGLVQSDRFGQLALDIYGYNDRRDFISSLDPIIVDNPSWLLAYGTNLLVGSARGGNNAQTGVFRFPEGYFVATRSVLFVTPSDVVFGHVPYHRP